MGAMAEAVNPSAAISTQVEYVTPEIARRWLLTRAAQQRSLRPHRVGQYARDMRQGRWSLTHQGIAFSDAGHLIDGQHRLAAVIEAGVSVDMMVTRGLPSETFVGMDRGMLRSAADNAPETWMANRSMVGCARTMMLGYDGITNYRNRVRPTDHETFAFMAQHREAVEFATGLFRQHATGVSQSSVVAVFGRALYSCEREFLEKCAEALKRGILPDASFSGMGALRSFLTSPKTRRGGGGGFQAEVYAKTERALAACMRGEEVIRLHTASEELFPLPKILAVTS